MSDIAEFFVPGLPKPAGSKRAFVIPGKNGARPRAIVTDACKTSRDWKGDVKRFAVEAFEGPPVEGPIYLKLIFQMPRPQGHFRTGNNAGRLRNSAPIYPFVRPDLLKLARAVEDSLTGVLYKDDAQICEEPLEKVYGGVSGVHIICRTLYEH